MYETRRHCAVKQNSQNENTRNVQQANAHFMQKGARICHGQKNDNLKGKDIPVNNRRALGEIGNLVGALSTRCAVSKNGLLRQQERDAIRMPVELNEKGERPVTRKVGDGPANKLLMPRPHVALSIHPAEETGLASKPLHNNVPKSLRSKQRRTMGQPSGADQFRPPMLASSQQTTEYNAELPRNNVQLRTLTKVPANFGNLMPVMKMRQTLTAALMARSEAACGGFEVEMEEAQEPLPNIDVKDVGNQLAVVDYVEDIYSFYRKAEVQNCISPEYMACQSDINEKMRAIMNDWLIEVHLKFKFMPETLFLTINLIDRFLSCYNLTLRKDLQLVGVTAMLLACKYEEIWAPEIKDFARICDGAYTKEQIVEMEKLILNRLKFNLTVPTPYVFLVRFLKAAISDNQLEMLAFFLTELCLTEYTMIKYCPSLLAAAAVYTAQQMLKRLPAWSKSLHHHSGYTEMQLRDCSLQMAGFHRTAGTQNLMAVYKKYANAKFCSVATLEPAVLS